MPQRPIQIGDVLKVTLPEQDPQGSEQEGYRRAVVVGIPSNLGPLRFGLLVVVPFTSNKPEYTWAQSNPAAYPVYPAGTAGLTEESVALIDQVRALDPSRVHRRIGALTAAELEPIQTGLRRMFGF